MNRTKLQTLLISIDLSIKQAMHRLSETAEKILFVIDDNGRLLGTATDGDIRRGLLNGFSFGDTIDKVMCGRFTALSQGMDNMKERAQQIMLEKKIDWIPIVDKNGVITDVIVWTDFFSKGEKEERQSYSNPVVIMAGGKGTRLDPFTKILPKALIPIENKTVIELIMERFYKCGFSRFFYTLNYKKEYIKLFLKENSFPYSIDWVEETDFFGTAGSISLLEDVMEEPFFVANCDSLLDVDFSGVLRWHKKHQAAITIIGCHNEIKIPFGVLQTCNGKLDRILEKPIQDILINTGVYLFDPHVIRYIPRNQRMDMNELIDIVSKKEKVTVYPIECGWFDMGQWEEYRKSVEQLEER